MSVDQFDVAVIGSGPGGCTAATFLAQKGYRVLIMEREEFPRFHVGESLLPATQEIWERMGVAERLQHSGHTFKYGGQFRIGNSPQEKEFVSATVNFHNVPKSDRGPRPFAYQVERAVFDKQLQEAAREHGVTVWGGTAVEEVLFDDGPNGRRAVGVKYRRAGEPATEMTCSFVIDASGRRCLIGRQLDCVQQDPVIKTSAAFGHFHGVQRDPGFKQGLFRGYFIENGWIWLIPLANDVMSVGVVQNEPATKDWSNNAEEVLLSALSRYEFIRQHFENAVQVGRIRSIRGIAYQTNEFCGDGWLAIGDANFFVDPLYSSGVHLAQSTGEHSANVVDEFLKGGRDMRVIEHYRQYITAYRRDVFGIIRAVYRLLRNRSAIRFFVWSVGPNGGDFDNWFLRRIAAWSSGYFQRNWLVMRTAQFIGNAIATVVPQVTRLWGDYGWKRFEAQTLQSPRLSIAKHIHEGPSITAAVAASRSRQTIAEHDAELTGCEIS